jgi:hypothetical protein
MPPNVLLLSQRSLADLVAYCIGYEFEDIIEAVTQARRVNSVNIRSLEFSRRAYKLLRIVSGSASLARRLAPGPRDRTSLDADFELFCPVFNHTYELYSLATIPHWRKRCRKAACFITESWSDMLPGYLVELLADFDHIFLGCKNAVAKVAQITGRPCSYLPIGVDVLRFMPDSLDSPRPIDVTYIGRRSAVTHRALLEASMRRRFFYYYDTVVASGVDQKHRTFRVDQPAEHRRLLASLLKRSSYYFANRSYINRPEFTAGRDEMSSRFYEGAASGAVMLGEPPRTAEFENQFDWPDAVIRVPFDSPDIGDILDGLDADPGRLRAARRNGMAGAARRHDWVYRLQAIYDALDVPHTAQMQERVRRLDDLAGQLSAT